MGGIRRASVLEIFRNDFYRYTDESMSFRAKSAEIPNERVSALFRGKNLRFQTFVPAFVGREGNGIALVQPM